MWRLAVLALLLCAGCGTSDMYTKDTRTWLALPTPDPIPSNDAQP